MSKLEEDAYRMVWREGRKRRKDAIRLKTHN